MIVAMAYNGFQYYADVTIAVCVEGGDFDFVLLALCDGVHLDG